MEPYEMKAHALILALCFDSWKRANTAPNGRRYTTHHPYTVPALAQALVEHLGRHDEAAVKALLLDADSLKHI